jgi:biotin carboxylase
MPVHAEPAEVARSARYPCVVKPLGLSGSRGVIRADYESDFIAAVHRIRALLESPDIRRTREEQNDYLLVEDLYPRPGVCG